MNYIFTSTIKIRFTHSGSLNMLQMESVLSLDREGGKTIVYFPIQKIAIII